MKETSFKKFNLNMWNTNKDEKITSFILLRFKDLLVAEKWEKKSRPL